MKGEVSVPKPESDWEAESDARSLIEYNKIMKDPKRFARAKKALVKMEKEAEETLLHTKTAKKLKALGGDS